MLESENINVENAEGMVNHNEEVCKKCGQKYIDNSESRYSILCTECRERQLKYPIPKVFLLLGIGLAVLVIAALINFPKTFADYAIYKTAEEKADDGYVDQTLSSLEEVIKRHPDTTDIAVTSVDIAMENGNYEYAAYMLDNYLYGKTVSDSVYNSLESYSDKIDSIYNVYDAYSEIATNMDTNLSEDEIITYFKENLFELLNDDQYDKATIYFYLHSFANDNDEAKEYLNKCLEEDPKLLEPKVQLANAYRREGNINEAKNILNDVIMKERSHAGAKRGLAIVNMLEGNYKEAVELARSAYEKDKDYPYVYETLAIALYFNGQVEESNKILEEFKSAGNEIEEDTKELLSGQLTLKQYYQE